MEAKPAALEAVQDVARSPEDHDAQIALRHQWKKILKEDLTLAAEVTRLVQQITAGGNIASVSGERSVAIVGKVSGSTIVTGDYNRVER